MLDASFVTALRDLSLQTQKPVVHDVPGLSKSRVAIWNPKDGEVEFLPIPRDANNTFLSLPTLIEFSRSMLDVWQTAFWYSRSGVVYCSDAIDTDLARASLPLTLSAPIQQLAKWSASHEKMTQDTAVMKLRALFTGTNYPGDILAIVSGIAWKLDETGKSAVANGARSVGRAIEARIENRERLPDTVVFQVPVWENGGELITSIRVSVCCILQADPNTQTFCFIPQAGAVEQAINQGEADLETRIRAQIARVFGDDADVDKPNVYHGIPTKI